MKSVLFSPCSMYILFLFVARLPGKHSIVRNSFQLQFNTNIQFIKSSHFERILKHVCFYTLWQGLAVGEIIKSFIIFQCDTKRILSTSDSFQCISMSGLSDWSNRRLVVRTSSPVWSDLNGHSGKMRSMQWKCTVHAINPLTNVLKI